MTPKPIKSAPKDRPILIFWLGFWRPIQWATGKTSGGWWKCLCGCSKLDVDNETKWMEMPPRP